MHTTRRFFLALLTVVAGIAVPMTLKPSGVVLAVMWSLIGVALLGALLTWEPVARRLPYRVVRTVNPHELAPQTARADAALADDCERVAREIRTWLKLLGLPRDESTSAAIEKLPREYNERFDGRVYAVLEQLTNRRYITRDQLRHFAYADMVVGAERTADFLEGWARRLRRR